MLPKDSCADQHPRILASSHPAAILSFITYAHLVPNLPAATLFTVITLFQLIRLPLMLFPMTLSAGTDAMQAIGRLEKVFMAETRTDKIEIDLGLDVGIKVEHASWTWDSAPVEETVVKKTVASQPEISEKPVEREIFQLRDINLSIPRGALVAVVGAIGSGKSSLLSGMVNEMRRLEGKVIFGGTTSMVPQTPWIVAATLRENILFGLAWNEERYWWAVREACLEPDLDMLEDGDATSIGEKGINLSVSKTGIVASDAYRFSLCLPVFIVISSSGGAKATSQLGSCLLLLGRHHPLRRSSQCCGSRNCSWSLAIHLSAQGQDSRHCHPCSPLPPLCRLHHHTARRTHCRTGHLYGIARRGWGIRSSHQGVCQ